MDTNETNILKKSIAFGDWIPKKVVQDFFNYGNTKMSTFSSDYNISTSKIGKRIFYKYSDILRLIEESILDNQQ
jgi:EAL domain-containing protein (putative c-di-GMP-specific phosphodiesterase class I)